MQPLVFLLLFASATQFQKLVDHQWKATLCPGLSVALAVNHHILFSKAYGSADLEQSVPMTPTSVHRLASLSKPITGTILLELVEGQRLSLDDKARKYLPELPAAYGKVTIRHLLTHQAGVRGYRDMEEVFSSEHFPTSRAAVKMFVNDPLLFEPGSLTEYSTYGFTLLGAVAEVITGRPFQRLSQDFFHRHSIAGFSLDDPLAIVPHRVRGYLIEDEGTIHNARAYDPSNKYPAGGFVASPENYLRFVLKVAAGEVLKPETVKEMWTAHNHFGLGWGVSTYKDKVMVGSNGLQPGSQTIARYLPESGSGLVLACNAEGAKNLDNLVESLMALLAHEPGATGL